MKIDLDLRRFWEENRLSSGKPFRTDKPRAPVSLPLDDHWLIEEMALPSTIRYYEDKAYQAKINAECNDRLEEAVGIRPFSEKVSSHPLLRIEEVMGSRYEVVEGGTPWLEPGPATIEEMHARLDFVESLSDEDFLALVCSKGGALEHLPETREVCPGSRGPATMATSILGSMNAMYWIVDYPEDMDRFFKVLGDTIVRYHRLVERETNAKYAGYYWLDDNCCLYSPLLYERYCYPVMKRVMEEFAPLPEHYRFQHSDSEMRHLLPYLADYGLHGVNLGPTIPASLIREALPKAVIHGQVAPMTLRNGGFEAIVSEVRRDFESVGSDGGLVVTTAGSISAGTSLQSIREFMWAVQEYCRYG